MDTIRSVDRWESSQHSRCLNFHRFALDFAPLQFQPGPWIGLKWQTLEFTIEPFSFIFKFPSLLCEISQPRIILGRIDGSFELLKACILIFYIGLEISKRARKRLKTLKSFFCPTDLILSLRLEENQGKWEESLVIHLQFGPGAVVSVIFVPPVLYPRPAVWCDSLRF